MSFENGILYAGYTTNVYPPAYVRTTGVYNEDYECYECLVNLDEDETARFLSGHLEACPYYSGDDEYAIVRKQN